MRESVVENSILCNFFSNLSTVWIFHKVIPRYLWKEPTHGRNNIDLSGGGQDVWIGVLSSPKEKYLLLGKCKGKIEATRTQVRTWKERSCLEFKGGRDCINLEETSIDFREEGIWCGLVSTSCSRSSQRFQCRGNNTSKGKRQDIQDLV